jgi:hypothetical protein
MLTEMTAGKPQVGDKYHCEMCGMEIEVIMPCQTQHTGPEFRCCGADMAFGGTPRDETLTPEAARGDYTA